MHRTLPRDAGPHLVDALVHLRGQPALVMAIPRRGVTVAHAIARGLRLPLDLVLATRVVLPGRHPTPIGAVALGGVIVTDPAALTAIDTRQRDRLLEHALAGLEDLLAALRSDEPLPELRGKVVILVDDAAITGLTLRAAVESLAAHDPARIVIATPLCATEAEVRLRELADQLVALEFLPTPDAARLHDQAAAAPELGDDEIRALVAEAQRASGSDLYHALEIDS